MKLKDMDIVYVVKDSEINEELRYSIRSVVKNLPHKRILFIGGMPKALSPDGLINVTQNGATKWDNTNKMIRAICMCDVVSDDFILFNDDFYVMKKINNIPNYCHGTLQQHVAELRDAFPNSPDYRRRLSNACSMLRQKDLHSLNYELHVPLIINKEMMLNVYKEFPWSSAVRSLYCNRYNLPNEGIDDVKIVDLDKKPTGNETYLSTSDRSFENGLVGEYIRSKFKNKSEYEID